MNNDVRIKNDLFNFHLRVAGVVTKDDKFLVQRIEGYDYYILPGGHVQLGENIINALKREIKEELNCTVKDYKYFCYHENFYTNKGRREHWSEHYFTVCVNEELPEDNWQITEKDGDEEKILNYYWMTKEQISEIDLKPTSIKKIIVDNKIDSYNFIVDDN